MMDWIKPRVWEPNMTPEQIERDKHFRCDGFVFDLVTRQKCLLYLFWDYDEQDYRAHFPDKTEEDFAFDGLVMMINDHWLASMTFIDWQHDFLKYIYHPKYREWLFGNIEDPKHCLDILQFWIRAKDALLRDVLYLDGSPKQTVADWTLLLAQYEEAVRVDNELYGTDEIDQPQEQTPEQHHDPLPATPASAITQTRNLTIPPENNYRELLLWLDDEKAQGRDWLVIAGHNRTRMCAMITSVLGWHPDPNSLGHAINRKI